MRTHTIVVHVEILHILNCVYRSWCLFLFPFSNPSAISHPTIKFFFPLLCPKAKIAVIKNHSHLLSLLLRHLDFYSIWIFWHYAWVNGTRHKRRDINVQFGGPCDIIITSLFNVLLFRLQHSAVMVKREEIKAKWPSYAYILRCFQELELTIRNLKMCGSYSCLLLAKLLWGVVFDSGSKNRVAA